MPEGLNPTHDQWHPRRAGSRSTIEAVTNATDERASSATGLAAALAAGGAVAVSALTGGWQPGTALATAWWLSYAAYVLVFASTTEFLGGRPLLPERAAAWSSSSPG